MNALMNLSKLKTFREESNISEMGLFSCEIVTDPTPMIDNYVYD